MRNPLRTLPRSARSRGPASLLLLVATCMGVGAQERDLSVGDTSVAGSAPQLPWIELDRTVGPVPLTVNFSAKTSWEDLAWDWDFGDGGRSNAPNPSYSFTEPGTYTVQLTVTGVDKELTVTEVDLITVEDPLPTTVVMTRVTGEVGLTETFTDGNSHTGGNAWVDVNGDYWPDLFITNGSGLDHYLYINNGDGTFTDRSLRIQKPDLDYEDAGVKFGDIDNDGDSDLFVFVDSPTTVAVTGNNPTAGGPNLLYLNLGNVTFAEVGALTGIVDPDGRRSGCGALADYDRDGLLDVFIGEWAINQTPIEDNFDRLLRNTGSGFFEDVTALHDVASYGLDTLTCGWLDADLDGWPDLYVGTVDSPFAPIPTNQDVFYANDGGLGFEDVWAPLPSVGDDAWAAMGWDVGDIDADGDWDFYVTDMYQPGLLPKGNVLYLGDGEGFGDNVADLAGVQAAPSWPCNFADFDRDGWVDLWVGTLGVQYNDYVYLNNRDGTFSYQNVPELSGNGTRGGSIADYDGDGDVDLFLHNFRMDSVLMRNDSTDENGWFELKLLGQVSNRDAIGAHVDLFSDGLHQMRRVSGGDSAHSQADLILHFGVAQASTVDFTVTWPSGIVQEFEDVPTGELAFVDELAGLLTEELVDSSAAYDPLRRELAVRVRSSFGGRTRWAVEGFGALDYRVDGIEFARVFQGVDANPGTVRVESERGGAWTLPVVSAPRAEPRSTTR